MSATEDFKTLVMDSDVGSTMIRFGGKSPTGSLVEHPAVDFLVEQVYFAILSPSLKPREAVLRHEVWRESLFHGWVCW